MRLYSSKNANFSIVVKKVSVKKTKTKIDTKTYYPLITPELFYMMVIQMNLFQTISMLILLCPSLKPSATTQNQKKATLLLKVAYRIQ